MTQEGQSPMGPGTSRCALLLAAGVLWWQLGCGSEQEPQAASAPSAAVPVPAEPPVAGLPPDVDVVGLPPLFPEGLEHEANPISFADYSARFGAAVAIDPQTRRIREDVEETLERELVGRQVTWEGYVDRIRALPSGRVTLVLAAKPENSGLDKAMIKFAGGESEGILDFTRGDRVRVVAVFDRITSVFPSLRGLEVQMLEQEGLVSRDPAL